MKNVLVIAYYFPPMSFSGVQRTLKFVKYLPDYGWQPTVLTIHPHAYFAFDEAFLGELSGKSIEIWRTNPPLVFSAVKGKKNLSFGNETLRKFANRISQFLFIPDNKIGWKKQALEFLETKDLSKFDAIYSSAPPYTCHLLAQEIKKRWKIPFVADFRDAWLEYPYHIYWTAWHKKRHQSLEQGVIESADAVITTNDFVRDLFVQRYNSGERSCVIGQGFDSDDFSKNTAQVPSVNPQEVNFVFTGIFYEDRDPLLLYKALASIKIHHPKIFDLLRFTMVGHIQEQFQEAARSLGVAEKFNYCGYLPHAEAIAWQKQADVLWFNIGSKQKGFETVAPGKVYEYLGSGKPILAILPENHIKKLLSGFEHCFLIEPNNQTSLENAILVLSQKKLEGNLPKPDGNRLKQFDRKVLTRKLAEILDGISSKD